MDKQTIRLKPKHRRAVVRIAKELELCHVSVGECIDEHFDEYNEDSAMFVTKIDGEVVGFVALEPDTITSTRSWHICWLFVAHEYQHESIGRTLLNGAEAYARQNGGVSMTLNTSSLPEFIPARALYVSNGYDKVGLIPNYYAEGEHRITFTKSLTTIAK